MSFFFNKCLQIHMTILRKQIWPNLPDQNKKTTEENCNYVFFIKNFPTNYINASIIVKYLMKNSLKVLCEMKRK